MQTQRIPFIDFIKGIAIILVVIGHFIEMNMRQCGFTDPFSAVWSWIYSFHMPLFFFASAYLTTISSRRHSLFYSVIIKTETILLPYIVWMYLIPINCIHSFLWFLPALYVFSLLYLCFDRIEQGINFNMFLFVPASIAFFVIPLCVVYVICPNDILKRIILFVPMYVSGFLFSKYSTIMWLKKKNWLVSITFILFLLSSLLYKTFDNEFYNYICKMTAGICSILVFSSFCTSEGLINWNNKFIQAVSYCGKKSMYIYLNHGLFVLVFVSANFFFFNNMMPYWQFLIALVAAFLIICGCLLVGYIVDFFRLAKYIIYGGHLSAISARFRSLKF